MFVCDDLHAAMQKGLSWSSQKLFDEWTFPFRVNQLEVGYFVETSRIGDYFLSYYWKLLNSKNPYIL